MSGHRSGARRLIAALTIALGAAAGSAAGAGVPTPVRLTITPLQTGTRQALLDVEFVDAQRGFAVGAEATILSTADGGTTWARQDVAPAADAIDDARAFSGLSFPDAQHGYVVGNAAGPRVLATADGGATWEFRADVPPVEAVISDPAARQWSGIQDVSFSDADHGHGVMSTYGAIFATSDGGRSWRWQGNAEFGSAGRVEFVDRDHGWVVGGTGELAVATRDGGNTWLRQQGEIDPVYGVTQAGYVDLDFADRLNGHVVRYDGEILATRDGGTTWAVQREEKAERFQAVAFGDRLHGVVVGSVVTDRQKAVVFATEDGGQTWTTRVLQDVAILWGVDFATPDTAYAVGCKAKPPGVGDGSPLRADADTRCIESAAVKISLLGAADEGSGGGGSSLLLPVGALVAVVIGAVVLRARRR